SGFGRSSAIAGAALAAAGLTATAADRPSIASLVGCWPASSLLDAGLFSSRRAVVTAGGESCLTGTTASGLVAAEASRVGSRLTDFASSIDTSVQATTAAAPATQQRRSTIFPVI